MQEMLLIADSGSTNCNWVLASRGGEIAGRYQTNGINPFFQDEREISNSVKSELNIVPGRLYAIYFYGAGCSFPEKKAVIEKALRGVFDAGSVHVESDLLGAARSLCGNEAGIAAILGTGSNSCYYDGMAIARQVPSLGYILGDEGSGAVMGKRLLSGIFKNQLPSHLCQKFHEAHPIGMAVVLEQVYRQPFPNRFLAGFTRFIKSNIAEESLNHLVKQCFIEFFEKNINQYHGDEKLPANFTGNVAWHFGDQLREAASLTGNKIGKITSNPVEGLVNFHCNKQ